MRSFLISFLPYSEQLYEISRLDFCKHAWYCNATHFFWSSDVKWITVTAGRTPQGWILSTPPLSLDNGLKQWSLFILFLKFCLTRGIDILSDQKFWSTFFPLQTCAASLFFSRQNKPIILVYVRIQHLQSWSWSLVFMLNFYCSVHVFLFACAFP